MIPEPTYRWICPKCGKQFTTADDEDTAVTRVSPTCNDCGIEMAGAPMVHTGPHPKNHPYIRR